MRALTASVLAIEAIVILLATSLATSDGSVQNTTLAWWIGGVVMLLLVLNAGLVGRRHGITLGWIMQVLVLASAIVVGWTMLVVGLLFVILWWAAIYLGSRGDRLKAERTAADPGE